MMKDEVTELFSYNSVNNKKEAAQQQQQTNNNS